MNGLPPLPDAQLAVLDHGEAHGGQSSDLGVDDRARRRQRDAVGHLLGRQSLSGGDGGDELAVCVTKDERAGLSSPSVGLDVTNSYLLVLGDRQHQTAGAGVGDGDPLTRRTVEDEAEDGAVLGTFDTLQAGGVELLAQGQWGFDTDLRTRQGPGVAGCSVAGFVDRDGPTALRQGRVGQ